MPERIDTFLIGQLPDYSRSYFQKLIKGGFILVNGSSVQKSFMVSLGDEIKISIPEPRQPSVDPIDVPFDILALHDDFLVINKPAGLTVHHSKDYSPEPTLVHGLLHRFQEFKAFDNSDRPGIVHRLDKQTSGLLIVARNERSLAEFSRMFKTREIKKEYLAVVKGHPDPQGIIDLPVGRHPVERNKMSHVSYRPREARTEYTVIQYYKNCALVRIRLITGRTHQIRVHFAAKGHGLLGDSMYGLASKRYGPTSQIKRQALHAWRLSFTYKGTTFSYFCPVPNDFKKLLRFLKAERIIIDEEPA